MSMRSASVSADKDHIAKAFMRSFIELVENFIDQDAYLDVVYKCLTALFDAMNVDDRSLVLKKILMHFLKKFPIDFEDITKADEYIQKTLELWRIFGMCSKTMGPVAILEKIEDTYAGCWQYYKMYAESLIEEERTDELYKTFKNCIEHCDLTNDEVRKIFGPKVMVHVKFPEAAEEDECTIQFMQIRQNDIRKSLAARRRSTVTNVLPKDDFKAPNIVLSQRKPLEATTVENSIICVPPKDDFSVLKDSIVSEQRNKFDSNATTQSMCTQPKDNFSVFRDPTIQLGQRKSFDANANSPTVCGTHLVPKKLVNASDPLLTSTPDQVRKARPPLNIKS